MATTTEQVPRVVILGVGNLLLGDEGIGVHVAHALEETPSPGNVALEVLDGGTLPDIVASVGEADKLIIVDAVQGGDEPGAIYRFRPEEISLDNNEVFTSLHQINLLEELWMTERFGQKPKEVVIIGVEPEDMSLGLELSAKLQERIPQIIEVVLEEVGIDNTLNAEKGR